MKNYLRTLVFLLISISSAKAQNGTIVEKKPYTLADTTIARIEQMFPHAKTSIHEVDFFRIIYLSDGLKVTGYLSIPKKTGKYPCIIYNRGGNREFGALNDARAARQLGEIAS